MTALFSIIPLILVPGWLGDSAEPYFLAYAQNRNSFVAIELEFTWSTTVSDEFRKSREIEIAAFAKQIATTTLPPDLIDRITAEAGPGVDFSVAKQRFIDQTISAKRDELISRREADRYFLRLTPEMADLHIFINNELDNPRRQYALDHGIASVTGGDFKRLQRQTGGKWIGLDPYPTKGGSRPVGLSQSTLQLDTMLPPYVDAADLSIQAFHSNEMDEFWKDPEKIVVLGAWSPEGSDNLLLLAKEFDQTCFFLAAVDPSRSSILHWVSRWDFIDGNTFGQLTGAIAADLATRVEFFRENSISSDRKNAVPECLVYFDSYKHIEGAGWYPLVVTRKPITLFYTADAIGDSAAESKLPYGIHQSSVLAIQSIVANASVSDQEPLKLDDGTAFLDLDTHASSIIGESPDTAIDRFLGDKQADRRAYFLLAVNGAGAALIVLVYLMRRARRRK